MTEHSCIATPHIINDSKTTLSKTLTGILKGGLTRAIRK